MVGRCSKQKKSVKSLWKCSHHKLYSILVNVNFFIMNSKIFAVSMLIYVWAFAGCSGPASQDKTGQDLPKPIVNDLPNMAVTLLDGSIVNAKELKGETVLIIFRPDCDHCQREAKEIKENLLSFKKSALYFITSEPLEQIEKFARDYDLLGRPNVFFGWTPVEHVLNNYGPIATPSMYIYSSEHKLIKAFNGEVEIGVVLKYI